MASCLSLTVRRVRNGLGIVTAKPIRQGATIVEIKGKIVTAGEVWRYWKIDSRLAENCFRYDEERYLDPNGEIGQYANHSCNPNAGIVKKGGRLILIAIASIAAGEEVTIARQDHHFARTGDRLHHVAGLGRQQFVAVAVEQQQRPAVQRTGDLTPC